jgi:hypothetical protein
MRQARHTPAAARLAPLLALLLSGCGWWGLKQADTGRFEGRVFVQDSFGMRLPFPEGWTILTPEETSRVVDSGRQVLSGGDPAGGAYRAGGAATSKTLFTVLRYPRGSVTGLNPSLVGAVENVLSRPQIKTPADYLQMVQSFLGRGGVPMTMEPIVPEAQLAGRSFAMMPVTLQPGPVAVGQIYYCRRIDDQMLTLVASFSTEDQWKEIEQVLAGMTIEK